MVGSGWDFTKKPEDDPNQSSYVGEEDDYEDDYNLNWQGKYGNKPF